MSTTRRSGWFSTIGRLVDTAQVAERVVRLARQERGVLAVLPTEATRARVEVSRPVSHVTASFYTFSSTTRPLAPPLPHTTSNRHLLSTCSHVQEYAYDSLPLGRGLASLELHTPLTLHSLIAHEFGHLVGRWRKFDATHTHTHPMPCTHTLRCVRGVAGPRNLLMSLSAQAVFLHANINELPMRRLRPRQGLQDVSPTCWLRIFSATFVRVCPSLCNGVVKRLPEVIGIYLGWWCMCAQASAFTVAALGAAGHAGAGVVREPPAGRGGHARGLPQARGGGAAPL